MSTMRLSTNEIKILTVLQKYGNLSRKDLIKKTGISAKNISRYVKHLISKKLITSEMQPIPNTKTREAIITITSKGKKISLDGIPEIEEIEEKPAPKKISPEAEKYIEFKKATKPKPEFEEYSYKYYIKEIGETQNLNRLRHWKYLVRNYHELITVDQKHKLIEIIEAKEDKIKKAKAKKPKKPVKAKPLPEDLEMKKELRLLINLVLTHRKEEYARYGYKSVSEIRSQIDTLIDQL